jgi:hypothetical protein
MRIASRVIGAVLGLTGLGFIVLPGYAYALGQLPLNIAADWLLIAILAGIGIGLIMAGWYYLQMGPEREGSPRAASRVDLFVAAHRRELRVLAQTGFVISVARLGAVAVGIDWPGRWAGWILAWLALALLFVRPGLDWNAVPQPRLPFVKALLLAGQVALFVLGLSFVWNQWHHNFSDPVLESGFSALLYGWAAITFASGGTKVPAEI